MKKLRPLTEEELLHMRLRAPALETDEEVELLRDEKKRLIEAMRYYMSANDGSKP